MPLFTHQPRPNGAYRDAKGGRFEILSADHHKETFGGGLATLKRDGQVRLAVNGWKASDSTSDYATLAGLTPVNSSGMVTGDASSIAYSNVVSLMAANTVQAAIDELDTRLDIVESASAASTVTDNGDGTFTHDDGQGTTQTWGASSSSVTDNGDGTYTYDNGVDPAVTWGPDANTYGSVTDNGDGTFTFDNGVDPASTWDVNAPGLGTVTDNGDGTYTFDNGTDPATTWGPDANTYGSVTDNADGTFTFDNGVDPAITWDTGETAFVGATAGTAGTAGDAPAPAAGDQAKFLRGDGTWQTISAPAPATLTGPVAGVFTFNNGVDPATAIDTKAPNIILDTSNFIGGPLDGTHTDVQAAVEALNSAAGPMIGASAGSAGATGLVPAPVAGDEGLFLQGDGRWEQAGLQSITFSATDGAITGGSISLAPGDSIEYEAGAGIELSGNDAVNRIGVSGNPVQGATATNPGVMGMVPQPPAGAQESFLAGTGNWAKGPVDFVRGSTLKFEPSLEPLTRETIMVLTSTSFFNMQFDVSKTDASTSGVYIGRVLRNADADFPTAMSVSWLSAGGTEKINGVTTSTASIPVKPGSREGIVIFDWQAKNAYAYFI